ncbi:manganese catalase family protein [Staphylococcus gallinarum]|uniref:manganese catalase family protein n=1 Tax=Staphylococcus gallinarum TaxID=1293 RepID=UPI001E45E23F|nr:manganese catalase family protein [Staphylococcus gallinarum]MCD8787436.1 manganese catalase family protein [Staphylococcus gallinarum]MCD8845242.1 manganese catalase family protein [Staphylococcus gallinarum]
MFLHDKHLQFEAKPIKSDPLMAKRVQELIGGQYGEMSVAMQYLFQGWSVRKGNEKYKDLLLDIGTEELGHIEMLATMVSRLLEGTSLEEQEEAMKDPATAAIMSGMNPQHAIVSGLNARPADSVGNPWMGSYIISSGNILADFRANLNAESQGRTQAIRIYEMTDDPGLKDMLSVLIARDSYHQNLWIQAIKELEEKEGKITPSTFDRSQEREDLAFSLYNHSYTSEESKEGNWSSGETPAGDGIFKYENTPPVEGNIAEIPNSPPSIHNTPPENNKR